MLSRILALAFAISSLSINVQAGDWSSYTNTDVVRQIVINGNRIWGATSGGVEALNYSTGEITKLTNTDGLKGIDITCAEIDTASSLWFGTSDGWLSKVSQSGNVQNYAFRDSVGLSGRAIALFDLKVDADTVWVASDIGVSKFLPYHNGGEIKETALQLGNLPEREDVICLEIIGDNLWAGTGQGIAFINKSNTNIQNPIFWRSFTDGESGLINADVRDIITYYDTILVGTADGVFKLEVSPDTTWASMGLSSNTIYKLYMAGPTLLAATDQGILQYDGTNWTAYINDGLPSGRANDLALDSRGTLWAATPGSGLGELTGSQWTLHSIPGPASNIINKLAFDSSGAVWMTHDGKGLSRFFNGQWSLFNSSNSDPDGNGPLMGLQDNDQDAISVAPNGNIWVGSYGGGLYEYDWTSWHHWNSSNCPMYGVGGNHAYWAATAVAVASTGDVWVSAFGSDTYLLMGAFAPYSQDSTWQLFFANQIGLTTNYIRALKHQDNILWVGRGDGLDKLDYNRTPYNTSDDVWQTKIGDQDIQDMSVDPTGTLWLATTTGLFFTNSASDSLTIVALPPEISGSVSGVASDGVGNIWVGTVAGLGMLKPNRFEPSQSVWQAIYTTGNSPILGDNVNNVAVDIPSGTVYIGTNSGLSVFNSGILPPRSNLADMAAFPNPVIMSEGVQFIEFERVPSSGTLSIYTASGDLVTKFDLAETSTWDLKNSKGESVAGGIYFFHVKSGNASGTGKIAIIK